MKNTNLSGAAVAALLCVAGCSDQAEVAPPKPVAAPQYTYAVPTEAPPPTAPAFLVAEPAADLGIDFVHETGARGKKLMPETMGPGCALFDYDGDGRLDVLFPDGHPFADAPPRPLARLYRNEGARFREVTADTGLSALTGYGMGAAAADYDGDGDSDLVVTTVTGLRLLRNDGGVFTDATAAAGLASATPEWATSAAWLDADNDGRLDLFVANYVKWSPETDVFTTLDGTNKSYATPSVYEGQHNRLFRNLGNGGFADVSAAAGFSPDGKGAENKALGVVVLDVNEDGFMDLFVANDTLANKLYVNDGRGVFTDTALRVGVGYDELGAARAGMGADAALSVDQTPAIIIGNFSDEPVSLYERTSDGKVFIDAAQKRGLATETLPRLTFGARFADLDQDGREDLILANGHIEPDIQKVNTAVTYRQPIDVFMATDGGRFKPLAELTGTPLGEPVVGRCVAVGDLDGDGDLDGLVSVNGAAPVILRNATGGERAVAIDLRAPGTGNTEGLGALVILDSGDWSRREQVRARGSYLGHSPYTLHFGVPRQAGDQVRVQVRWPDGRLEDRGTVAVGGHYRIVRGGDLTRLGPG